MNEYAFTADESDAPAQADLLSLNAWLGDNAELDAENELKMRPPADGEMGGQPEAVMALAVAAVPVARAFFGWLTEQVRSKRVAMTISNKYSGKTLTIEAGSNEEAMRLLPDIRQFFSESED